MTRQDSGLHRRLLAEARRKFILIMISVGVCKEVCIRGIQLCFLPTTSSLGHMTEQNNQHFMVDYVVQYEIPDT